MEKPQINIQTNTTEDATTTRDIPFTGRSFRSRSGGFKFRSRFGGGQTDGRMKFLLPLLLASVTGVLLGICLLILFKGQASEPTVTTIPAPKAGANATAPQVKGAAETGGESMYAWQLGVFQEREPAEKARQEFAGKDVAVSLRGDGPFQLFAAVAPDKKSGAPIEAELRKQKITYYAKEYKISAQQGLIHGLQEQEAKALGEALNKALKLAGDVRKAAVVGGGDTAAMQQQQAAVDAELKAGKALLEQANQQEDAARIEAVRARLADAVAAIVDKQELIDVQGKLTAFYVQYEQTSSIVIKNQ